MSVSEVANRSEHRGRAVKIWLALLVLIAAGIGLAWAGTAPLRGETTASGLQIRTVKEGSGPFIQSVDGVMVEYEGRLTDGTVFDKSGDQPVPMLAGQVIPGFAEALTKMQKGGSYKIRIPSELAYGASPPAGAPIPPNADLDFDVHIVDVAPNAAMMMGGGPGAGAPQPESQAQPQAQPEAQPEQP